MVLLVGNALALGQIPQDGSRPRAWVQRGFADFSRGQFDDGGSNLYVNAKGIIEMIHRWDVNNDGFVDLVLANAHDYIERGPTHVFQVDPCRKRDWRYQELPNDSSWSSRVIDIDQDGLNDLVIANGENGVTSELPSFVYWGGPDGLGAERTDLPTVGAYDVTVFDLNDDGRLDLVFPSAWRDHHNPGAPLPLRVYLQQEGRGFEDASERYGLVGIAAVSIASADLNKDGFTDLVVANYRLEHDLNTESFVYWGTTEGLDAEAPLRLPTYGALQVMLADLNLDGREDIIFAGGNQVRIYWNRNGAFEQGDHTLIEASGYSSMFSVGAVRVAVADVDGDGENNLILATSEGVQIRSGKDIQRVQSVLPVENANWVTASDLDGDGRPDLVVSRYDDDLLYDTQSPIFWNGPGGFSPERASWVATAGAMGSSTGDLDGDGRPEVVYHNTMSGHCSSVPSYIYLGNRDADYSVESRLAFPTNSSAVCSIADFDLDGYADVAFNASLVYESGTAITGGLRVFWGGPNGVQPHRYGDLPAANPGVWDVRTADFNRDGYLDLLAIGGVSDTKPETLATASTIFFGSEEGFSTSRIQHLANYGFYGAVADVNRDGYLDILFDDKQGYVLIYLGSAKGFSPDNIWKVPCPAIREAASINTADLNKDGWLDLIMGVLGHRVGVPDTLHIFYGSPEGYTPDNQQALLAGYSPGYTGVADFNNDGNLDLAVSNYSTATSRVDPAQVFWGNGKTLDLDHPTNMPAEGSTAVMQVDLNRDGWIDAFVVCHRNDIGHQVDSLIYWNSPGGFATDRVTRLPGLGPHGTMARDHGNAYTREPVEHYVSSAYDMGHQTAVRIRWHAEVPPPSELKFQLRWATTKEGLAQAEWVGLGGEGTYFERSAEDIPGLPQTARWLQYQAIFISPYGCESPQLRDVRVDLTPKS